MKLQKTHQVACHIQVRDVAMAATSEWYESLMGASNDIYKDWKAHNPDLNAEDLRKKFVNRYWPQCIDFARATLTLMLQRDEVSDAMKEQIMDVLEKDQYLRRKMPQQVQPFTMIH